MTRVLGYAVLFGLLAIAALLPPAMRAAALPYVAIATLTSTALYAVHRSISASDEIAEAIGRLDQIGLGQFDDEAKLPPAAISDGVEIRDAVDVMAQRIKHTIDGLNDVAQRDALTGLVNRSYFRRNVERLLQRSRSQGETSCLMFLDIDGFKSVNDTLGHNYGDRLLQIAADRLKLAARVDNAEDGGGSSDQNSIISRFGGDEFTVFIPARASRQLIERLAARIHRVLAEPFELGAHAVSLSASIGVAFSPQDGDSYISLLRAADTAMYHAKRCGQNLLKFYTPALDEEARRFAEREQELREALAKGEFELFYQPLYDCRTLRISSAEALIRWRHPKRGLIMPGEFIPLAEQSNLIGQIGEWVIGEAARHIADLTACGCPLRISINVSPNQLQQMEFIALVNASLKRWGAQPQLLELEITESMAMQNAELAADRLQRISKLGVSVAIDDFGTGYSNLASLIQLPFKRLKIDRSLLTDLTRRSAARVLVQTIISMANSLGFHSVAEGVETREQLDLLVAMGCDVAQGHLLSHPVSAADLRKLITSGKPLGLTDETLTRVA